jgi:pteridine reductase
MSTMAPKVALVTGSGKRRVGSAVVEALAARGYEVAIHYNRSADEAQRTVLRLKERGRRAAAFQADVAREADVNRLIEQTLTQFGRIDVLVTAAAVWEPKRLEDVSADDVQRDFEINALGTFLCAQKAGLAMARRPEGGVIVTIGDWAIARPYADYAAYFASKGSIPTITRALAVELAARNPAVRVNCILPGPVMLPDDMPADQRQRVINATLVKREGRPEHVAHAVIFLIENDFVTGVCLPVDGGRTIAGSGAIS